MHATNDVYWDEIVSIEHQDSMQVFAAEVFGTHNFIVDGVVVHNSLEQDADMVVLLHRVQVRQISLWPSIATAPQRTSR